MFVSFAGTCLLSSYVNSCGAVHGYCTRWFSPFESMDKIRPNVQRLLFSTIFLWFINMFLTFESVLHRKVVLTFRLCG